MSAIIVWQLKQSNMLIKAPFIGDNFLNFFKEGFNFSDGNLRTVTGLNFVTSNKVVSYSSMLHVVFWYLNYVNAVCIWC